MATETNRYNLEGEDFNKAHEEAPLCRVAHYHFIGVVKNVTCVFLFVVQGYNLFFKALSFKSLVQAIFTILVLYCEV